MLVRACAVGIASGALDLLENEMRWAIVESPDAAVRSPLVALVWQASCSTTAGSW